MAYWLELEGGRCVSADCDTKEEAIRLAEEQTGKNVVHVSSLPYPGTPRLDDGSNCPSFCYSPTYCKGRTSCPKRYACSE